MDLELIVKDPLVRGALALYPVFSPSPCAAAYLTGPEAERMGVLRVAEKPGGATVPELAIHNTGALPLLLLEGETLVGAKQNRTLDVSVLIPAGATVAVPVSCVEAGRWGAAQASYRSAWHSPGDLRRVKAQTLANPRRRASKQGEVWERIEEYHATLNIASPTSALEDAFTSRAADVTQLVQGTRPLAEQRGVIVAVAETVRSIDCFDKPATLSAYWDGLVAGYALDAVGVAPASPPTVEAAQRFASAVLAVTTTPEPTVGLGTASSLHGDDLVGHVLDWDAVVHISAFVDQTASDVERSAARPIRRSRGYTY